MIVKRYGVLALGLLIGGAAACGAAGEQEAAAAREIRGGVGMWGDQDGWSAVQGGRRHLEAAAEEGEPTALL